MPTHLLRRDEDPPDARWRIEWDDTTFELTDPVGGSVVAVAAAGAHRLVGVYELYSEGRVSIATASGRLTFRKHPAAVASLRVMFESNVERDPEYLAHLRRDAARAMPRGLVMFVAAGGLFALYCWWAFTAGDPPPGTWLRWALVWFGWLVHLVLIVLLGMALAGPWVSVSAARQWWRFRRIERGASARTPSQPA